MNRICLASEYQEHGLEGILRRLVMADCATADAPYHGGIAAGDFSERGIRPRAGILTDQFGIGSGVVRQH